VNPNFADTGHSSDMMSTHLEGKAQDFALAFLFVGLGFFCLFVCLFVYSYRDRLKLVLTRGVGL